MKVYAIRDKSSGDLLELGYFFYYEDIDQCCIELNSKISEWDYPFILDKFVRKKHYSVNEYFTRFFIEQRVIPSDRQNIASILAENGLDYYDEIKLFLLSDGRCAQDDCYIERISYDKLPEDIINRRIHLICGINYIADDEMIVTFVDGQIKSYRLESLFADDKQMLRLLKYRQLLENAEISGGGSGIMLANGRDISYEKFISNGQLCDLNLDSVMEIAMNNIMTTKDVMEMLNCTRQNVNDLVKRGKLMPITINSRDMFFRRDQVLSKK